MAFNRSNRPPHPNGAPQKNNRHAPQKRDDRAPHADTPKRNNDPRRNSSPKRDFRRDTPESESDRFFVCGVHPIEETLDVVPPTILGESKLFIADTRSFTDIQPLLKRAEEKHVRTVSCTMDALDVRAGETRHQGVLLEIASFPYADLDVVLEKTPSKQPLIVVLDQIQDPHNLGAIIRSAAAFGADAVVIAKDRAAQMTPTAIKTSAGQAWRVPVCRVTNIAQTLRSLKDAGFVVFGADIEGDPLPSIRFDQPCVIVMGSEGDGMRRLTRTLCDQFARIDMNPAVESLNVSVAAAIFLYQASLSRKL